MINAIECYKQAWTAYQENWKGFVLNGAVCLGITVVFLVVIFALLFGSIIGGGMVFGANSAGMPILIAIAIAALLVCAVVITTLTKGFYGVAYDVLEGRKVEPTSFIMHARKRFWTLAGITIIQVGLIVLLSILLVTLPTMLIANAMPGIASTIFSLALSVIMTPVFALVAMAFETAFPFAFVEYTGVFASISSGFGLIRKDVIQYLTLIVVSFVVDLANIVPFVQQLVTTPLNCTALLLYYKAGKESRRKK